METEDIIEHKDFINYFDKYINSINDFLGFKIKLFFNSDINEVDLEIKYLFGYITEDGEFINQLKKYILSSLLNFYSSYKECDKNLDYTIELVNELVYGILKNNREQFHQQNFSIFLNTLKRCRKSQVKK